MKYLQLARTDCNAERNLGLLYVTKDLVLKTLERPYANVPGATAPFCIPCGTYEIDFYDSPHNKCIVPLLKGVPGRSEIEIHIANYVRQLKGCIAVGLNYGTDCVEHSADAFKRLMNVMLPSKSEGWKITVSDVVLSQKP